MLDLVPLAGTGGEVADVDRHVELVGDALQLVLPHVRPIAVAAPGVGCDEYFVRLGVALGANSTRQASMDVTAKTGVSWSTPTLTKPSLAARS